MAELRQNPVTGRWIVMAPSRSERPMDQEAAAATVSHEGDEDDPGPARDPDCPFCPGNEADLPEVLWELESPRPPGWRCRAVPNRYPAFTLPTVPRSAADEPLMLSEAPAGATGAGRTFPARGRQEVLIESDRHDRRPARMSVEELRSVAEAYRERLRVLTREAPGLFPTLFRNHGAGAGASLQHPHAQLLGTRASGPARRIREERLTSYHAETDSCLLCRIVALEPQGDRRVVDEDDFHRAYVPWAPERPYEVWILPRRHRASFAEIPAEELESLASILRRTLGRIRILAEDPDYNYMLHTAAGARSPDPALHWFLQIRPVTARLAGFELGSGMIINPASPDEIAELFRRTAETNPSGGED